MPNNSNLIFESYYNLTGVNCVSDAPQPQNQPKTNHCPNLISPSIIEWPYFEIHCIYFSADFSAVSAVTSLCAVFFEMGSLVGFVVLEFPWDFFAAH